MEITNAAHRSEYMYCLRKSMHFSQDQKRNPRQNQSWMPLKGCLEMMFLVSLASVPLLTQKPVT